MDSEFYGTDYFIDRIDRELRTLTLEQVNAAITKYIDPNNMNIAMVAEDAEGLLDRILRNEPSPITYSSPVSQRILDEDKIIEKLPLEVNREKSRVVPVEHLFENESPSTTLQRKTDGSKN
jgi:hypothetical protein